jgi:hypothetical protein
MKAATANGRMNQIVRALRKAGWRVRSGWPSRQPSTRWDFIRGGDSLVPLTTAAKIVNDEIVAIKWSRVPRLPQLSRRPDA